MSKSQWEKCKHNTVHRIEQTTRSGGGFTVWKCSTCGLEFKPTTNKN